MEFLKSMDAAKTPGFSKDEFFRVWKMENSNNYFNEEQMKVFSNDTSLNRQPHEFSFKRAPDMVSTLEKTLREHIQRFDTGRNEMKQNVHKQLHDLHKQLKEAEDSWVDTVRQQHDTLASDVAQQIETLKNHVIKSFASQTTSLKIFFVQELELTKRQILDKINANMKGDCTASLMNQSARSKNVVPMPSAGIFLQSNNASEMNHGSTNQQSQKLQAPEPLQKLPSQKLLGQKPLYELQQLQQGDLQQQQLKRNDMISQSKTPPTTWAKVVASTPKRMNTEGIQQRTFTTESLNNSSTGSSVQGTGFIAKVFASQMKHQDSVCTGSLPSVLGSREDLVFGLPGDQCRVSCESQDNTILPNLAYSREASLQSPDTLFPSCIPEWGADFVIFPSDEFSLSAGSYVSQFYHTALKDCNIRFHLCFDVRNQLNVHLFISKGECADQIQWPVNLVSYGFIQNQHSNAYSNIWQIQARKLFKPEPGFEHVIKAVVCLSTSKGKYPNVTYEDLKAKGYALTNSLNFNWEVITSSVEENKEEDEEI